MNSHASRRPCAVGLPLHSPRRIMEIVNSWTFLLSLTLQVVYLALRTILSQAWSDQTAWALAILRGSSAANLSPTNTEGGCHPTFVQ